MRGVGGQKWPKIADVFYGRPLMGWNIAKTINVVPGSNVAPPNVKVAP